jgi:uncharacterized protein (TIGR03435 family)
VRTAAAILAIAGSFAAFGQPVDTPLAFEVASVKPSKPGSTGPTLRLYPGGRFTAEAITLRNLITLAYGIQDSELLGLPAWANSARFDIVAKARSSVANFTSKDARDHQMLRLRALLADRFQLKLHRTSERRRIMALVVGKNGPKLPQVKNGGCVGTGEGPGLITSMTLFALSLQREVGQTVVDRTGLQGFFCIRLSWSNDEGLARGLGVGYRPNNGGAAEHSDAPSIFSALQEQLGLKLQPENGLIEMLAVDHVAEPSSN